MRGGGITFMSTESIVLKSRWESAPSHIISAHRLKVIAGIGRARDFSDLCLLSVAVGLLHPLSPQCQPPCLMPRSNSLACFLAAATFASNRMCTFQFSNCCCGGYRASFRDISGAVIFIMCVEKQ